jgi:hypothetical protein
MEGIPRTPRHPPSVLKAPVSPTGVSFGPAAGRFGAGLVGPPWDRPPGTRVLSAQLRPRIARIGPIPEVLCHPITIKVKRKVLNQVTAWGWVESENGAHG